MSIARKPFCTDPPGRVSPGRDPGQGGYLLYRGAGNDGEAVDFDTPVGHGQAGGGHAYDYGGVGALAAETTYTYALRAVSDLGVEEEGVACLARVRVDGGGALLGPQPNAPLAGGARAIAGGYLQAWLVYSAAGQEAAPYEIQFARVVDGVADWGDLAASVVVPGAGRIVATVGPYATGELVRLAARAVTIDDVAGPELRLTAVAADADAPPAPEGVTAAQEVA